MPSLPHPDPHQGCSTLSPAHTTQGLSIACSTPEALAWDPSWENSHEISGRAITHVHAAGHGFTYQKPEVVNGFIHG